MANFGKISLDQRDIFITKLVPAMFYTIFTAFLEKSI